MRSLSCEQVKGMATSKEPIRQLLSRPEIKEKSKNLPKDYFTNAQHQYQNLLDYLRKLQQDYPDKAKTLKRTGKSTRTKKEDFSAALTKDKEISALYTVLNTTESKEEEWDEFYYLLNARYLLKELQKDRHSLPTHQSMHTEKMTPHTTKAYGHDAKASSAFSDRQTMGTVLGSGNNPTHQNIEGRPHSQSTQLQKDNHHLPTHQSAHTEKMTPHTTKADGHAKASPTSSDRQTMGIVLGSGNNPTHKNTEGRPDSQSYTEGMAIASDKTKNISDFQKTYHVCSVEPGRQKPEQPTKTGKSEIQPTVKAGKPERQQTDSSSGDIVKTGSEIGRPISQLLLRNSSKEAENEYQILLDGQKEMLKARQMLQTNKKFEKSDIEDITDEQRKKSPVLYEYLKKTFENIKDESQDLVKRALSEYIILTAYNHSANKKAKGASAAAPNFSKKDVPCASVNNVNKISQSEYANLKPIQKALNKLKLTCTDLTAAENQYYQLFKRDENFKRRFPEQHRELQVFMTDPEECAIASYKALYYALRRLQKTDSLYREAWEEFFFLITSEQQFIIAESCGKLTKTVYNKHSDTMVIPRKSYEELQNELVEKIKQIDELTSRLSKFASQQLTAGNPNIADLSDKHRPTKIGEFYSELYDNEWSEAFEVIKPLVYPNATEDPDTEYFEEVLRILKTILMAAYEFSAERTEKHLEDIKLTLLGTITDQEKDKAKGTEYDRFVTEHAMKYRKEAAAYAIKVASKAFKRDGLQKFLKQKSEDPKLLAYVDKCVELTWYMRIQDPPMHLHCLQEKETISKAEFAFHGRKGKTTLVCVWPALLLFEGGHLVTKGHVLPEE
ncbi:uncharacterized protein [Magallana gigas]|uniref:uncharacterized protein isoform X2 n=1 Tax=Magallana gigas TaxID=29159 RepID=UPI003340583D